MDNIMLDIETLSTRPDAAVFEVALVCFKSDGTMTEKLTTCFTPTTGHIDVETVKWWLERSDSCQLGKSAMSERHAAQRVWAFLGLRADHRLWAQPPSFDCIILQSWLMRHGYDMPIDFRKWRDVRTLRELASWPETERAEGHMSHRALDDCTRQVGTVVECWNVLRASANIEGDKK